MKIHHSSYHKASKNCPCVMSSCDHVVFQADFWIFVSPNVIKLGGVHVIIQVRVSFISDWNDLKFQHLKAVLLLPRAPTAPPLRPAAWCLGFSRNSSAAWRPAPSRRPVFGRSVRQRIHRVFHSLVFLLCESHKPTKFSPNQERRRELSKLQPICENAWLKRSNSDPSLSQVGANLSALAGRNRATFIYRTTKPEL